MEKTKLNPKLVAAWCLMLLTGTVFLFVGITHESLWYDEAYTGSIVNQSLGQIIVITGSDSHPPLYYLMLRLFTLIFGNSVLSLRAFSVLGVLALASWGIGPVRRIAGTRTGMLYTLLIFITPITLDMAQEARMYTWAAFFVTGSAVYGYLAYRDNRRRDWILFALLSLAAGYTHYYALLAVIILCGLLLLGILVARKKPLPFLCAIGSFTVGYLPWLAMLIPQIGRVSDRFWITPVTGRILWLVMVYPYSSKFSISFSAVLTDIAFLFALILMVKGIVSQIRKKEFKLKMPVMVASTYLLTIIAGALASWIIRPVLVERYMVPVLGLFILGVAYGVAGLKGRLRVVAACTLLLVLAVPQIHHSLVTRANGPMKEVQNTLVQKVQPGDVFLHTSEHTFGTFCYYFPDHRHYYYQREGYEGFSNFDAFKPNGLTIDSIDGLEEYSRIWLVQRTAAEDNISVNSWLSKGEFMADTPMEYYQLPYSWYGLSLCRATPGDPVTIAASAAVQDKANTLIVKISGFSHHHGKALVILYSQGPMEGPGVSSQALDIRGEEVEAVFSNMPYGEYAVSVIHDENQNQSLDFSEGIPSEGFGASNQNKPAVKPPVFDECKFQHKPEQNVIQIPLFYY